MDHLIRHLGWKTACMRVVFYVVSMDNSIPPIGSSVDLTRSIALDLLTRVWFNRSATPFCSGVSVTLCVGDSLVLY